MIAVLAEIVPEEIQGLPAHPLLVHVPVVLIPLAALGSLVALVVPRWRSWLLPLTALGALVAVVGVQLAMWSGENLREEEGGELVDKHAHLAEQTRPIAVIFLVLAVAAAVANRRARVGLDAGPGAATAGAPPDTGLARARAATVILCVVSVLFGTLSTVWVARTGDAGARAVWEEDRDDGGGNRGPGGGSDSGDDDDGGGNRGPGSGSDDD